MKRSILVVDDIRSNREILKKILGSEYRILEAAHGEEAIAIMSRCYEEISVVLLDLAMPVMDGFAVLEYMRISQTLYTLPVIVTTGRTEAESEMRALELGANDYIPKPYHAASIRQRIRNTIRLRETAASVNALRLDQLTGLPSRETFFERVQHQLADAAPGAYILASFDIDKFRVINDQYGIHKGDEVLRHVAHVFENGFQAMNGLCGRIGGDDFAVFYPVEYADSQMLADIRQRAAHVDGLIAPLSFSIGRYLVNDLTLSASAMYDRATLAAMTVKGRYDASIAFYDESMRTHLIFEQEIVSEMVQALEQKQFETWLQPQYNHATGALVGAEALVRWRHPERGMISPGKFIPIFERNGFVYPLDQYVWRNACEYLRTWLDAGLQVVPISVNISRYDILCPDLISVITNLIAEYQIPVELLRLEVTESAFAESTNRIVEVVKQLVDMGFTVEIDDFGSGYSSLNTLKNVPAQVLKLDMRFLEGDEDSSRGGNILESVVRMAKWLGMSIIAEGVEEKAQADFLQSIGCYYIQGYYYAKPMPMAEYEARLRGTEREERLLKLETVEHLDNGVFWDPKSMDTLIFNSYVGAACIFEYRDGKVDLLRVNEKYTKLFGTAIAKDTLFQTDFLQYLNAENRHILLQNMQAAIETRQESTCEVVATGLYHLEKTVYIRTTVRAIARSDSHYLFYCTIENVTAQRETERERLVLSEQLSAIMADVDSGVTAAVLRNGITVFLFSNDRYYELFGMTRAQYEREISDYTVLIHPDDRERVIQTAHHAYRSGESVHMEYRVLHTDGQERWLRVGLSTTHFSNLPERVQLCILSDITAEKQAASELLDNLPCGAALYAYDENDLKALHLNRRYWELVNRPQRTSDQISVIDVIDPADRPRVTAEVEAAIAAHRDMMCDIRVRYGSDGYRTFHVTGRIVKQRDGRYLIYASYVALTDQELTIYTVLPVAIQTIMENRTDISFLKDKHRRYLSCSKLFMDIIGVTQATDIIGKTDAELLEPKYAEKFAAADERVLREGISLLDDLDELPAVDDIKRYVRTSKFPLKDMQGNVIGIYGVGQDVTQQRAMESQLELLTNCIPGGIATYEYADKKLRLLVCNDGLCKLYRMTRPEFLAASDKDALVGIFAEDRPVLREQLANLFHHDIPVDCVYRVRLDDERYIWLNLQALSHDDGAGKVRFHAVFFDVTERQEAFERLSHPTDATNPLPTSP